MSRKERRAKGAQERKSAKVAVKPVQLPTGPNGDCCRTCRFCFIDNVDREKADGGACRVTHPTLVPEMQPTAMGAIPTGGLKSMFPMVGWWIWCGEHEPLPQEVVH